ncbi:hypothetical protein KIN20_019891 [Parelaphostrongylus tenuis]|uniref:Uncharacterized protein n=1 Tax=Parelaphostrongylus tenuis TaxID=148309 RepID=A0AAD5MLP2_PARTN|nr:hypothetical protein KIN20_019891 [Parelaphostrongylus tenuis]
MICITIHFNFSGPLIVTKRFQLDKNCTFRMENHILSTFIALLFLVEGFQFISFAEPIETVDCDGDSMTSMSSRQRGIVQFQHNRLRKNQKPEAPPMVNYSCDLEIEAGILAKSYCKHTNLGNSALDNSTNIAKRPGGRRT